jgi:hypothetical protein
MEEEREKLQRDLERYHSLLRYTTRRQSPRSNLPPSVARKAVFGCWRNQKKKQETERQLTA